MFSISKKFIDKLEVDVVHLDVYLVVFGSPYVYMMNTIFVIGEKQYH